MSTHNLHDHNPHKDKTLLEQALIAKAHQYLKDELVKAMDKDMKQIAVDAVKTWAEFRISLQPNDFRGETNIHVEFVEKVIRTEMKDHPIQITVKDPV